MAFGRFSARVVGGSGAADRIARVERGCQEILEHVKGLNEPLSLMARREDSEAWGTQLFTVDADEEAGGAAPH